jgi:hypothetical protein
MNKLALFLAPLLLAAYCHEQPPPQPPAPVPAHDAAPPPVPPPPDDISEAQCAREHELNCPEWTMGCGDDCRKADIELAKLNSPPPNHACVAHSVSCEEMRRCR